MMSRKLAWLLALGLAANAWSQDAAAPPVMVAKHIVRTVRMDGHLGDPAWGNATAYPLELANHAYANLPPGTRGNVGTELREKGWVKLLWTRDFLYVGAKLDDTDLVAEARKNQSDLPGLGDALGIFLKPDEETYYWELYGSPNNLESSFFYPGRGRLWPSGCADKPDIRVVTSLDGTLNDWRDVDKSWTVEIAIPTKPLLQFGARFDNTSKWTILVARHNYSRYLPVKENSSAPRLSCPEADNHCYEDYADLKLEE